MKEKPQLILVADDEKLLELAKGSKIKFDKQMMLDIAEVISTAFSFNPFGSLISSGVSFFSKKEKEKEKEEAQTFKAFTCTQRTNFETDTKRVKPFNRDLLRFTSASNEYSI